MKTSRLLEDLAREALKQVQYTHSWNLIEAGIGVAALNACMGPKR